MADDPTMRLYEVKVSLCTPPQIASLTVEKIQKEEKEVVSLHKKKFEMEQKLARYEADPTECDIDTKRYNRNFMYCIREIELFNNSLRTLRAEQQISAIRRSAGYDDYRGVGENSNSEAFRNSNNVFMRGIPFDVTPREMTGLVTFANPHDVAMAFGKNKQYLGRRYVDLFSGRTAPSPMRSFMWKRIGDSGPAPVAAANYAYQDQNYVASYGAYDYKGYNASYGETGGGSQNGAMMHAMAARRASPTHHFLQWNAAAACSDEKSLQMRKLFIGGLSHKTTNEQLKTYFSRWGLVVDAIAMRDQATKQPRGFGFVTFATTNSAEAAMLDRPHVIGRKTVDLKRAIPQPVFVQPCPFSLYNSFSFFEL